MKNKTTEKKKSSPTVKKSPTAAGVFQSPKGMHDYLPADQVFRSRIRSLAEETAAYYGFNRIETPILENAKLFERGVGEETEIVEKEMYTLKTKGGDLLAIRPEGTAPIIRAYIEHSMGRMGQPQKLYCLEPMLRHENPQAGRLRQFTQVDFEIIGGPNDPIFDALVVNVSYRLLQALKIKGVMLKINSIGCRVCRPAFVRQLQAFYRTRTGNLCADCDRRLKSNPMRLLDCKKESCEKIKLEAPDFLNRICSSCTAHLKATLEYLDELLIPYEISNQLVRGLDYYNRTVFEFHVEGPGSEVGAVFGGGRYDYLSESLGGKITAAVGGAGSIERITAVMQAQGLNPAGKKEKKIFVIHAGDMAKKKALALIDELRPMGIPVSEALARESLKAQLKAADKEGASLAVILGQREIFENTVIVRDLHSGLQETVLRVKLPEEIRKRLRSTE